MFSLFLVPSQYSSAPCLEQIYSLTHGKFIWFRATDPSKPLTIQAIICIDVKKLPFLTYFSCFYELQFVTHPVHDENTSRTSIAK